MKAKTFIFITILFMVIAAPLSAAKNSETIPLQVSGVDPTTDQDDPHKGPVLVPQISLDNHTLIIDQQSLPPDVHHFSVNISEKGLYVVSLILDGHVYVKKVSVK